MHMTTRSRGLVLVLGLLFALGAAPALASDDHPATTAEPSQVQPEHGSPAAAEHGGAHAEGHSAVPHLQNVLGLGRGPDERRPRASRRRPRRSCARSWTPSSPWSAVLILGILFVSIGTRMRDRDPGRLQLAAEIVIGGLYGLFEQILGKEARRFTPYLGTLFLFILVNNYMGLLPLGHSSTSSFANTTIGLGVLTFLYAQYVGIKENGILGYLYHFAGQPKSGIEWGFAVLIFPLELMGELIKPLSLSLRLFGNIFGEDTLLAVMVMLGTHHRLHADRQPVDPRPAVAVPVLLAQPAGRRGAGPGVHAPVDDLHRPDAAARPRRGRGARPR